MTSIAVMYAQRNGMSEVVHKIRIDGRTAKRNILYILSWDLPSNLEFDYCIAQTRYGSILIPAGTLKEIWENRKITTIRGNHEIPILNNRN